MEAKFESANSRYGRPPLCIREYHACSSGLVEESRKYGSPTVTASSATMRSEGCPADAARQLGFGMIGKANRLSASAAECTIACTRGSSFRCSQSAYR